MLYMLGPLMLNTRPMAVDAMSRETSADLATKAVMGGLKPSEFMGEGDETITLSGQLLPFKLGGLSSLAQAQSMQQKGQRFPLMRGDGARLGTYALVSISEEHKEIMGNGTGFVISYRLNLKKVQSDDNGALFTILGLFSLFAGL